MIDFDRFKRELLAECKEDHVGLWEVVWSTRFLLNREEPPGGDKDHAAQEDVRRMTLRVLKELLEEGLVQAGFPAPDGRGFQPWPMPPSEVVARVQSEWDALGREPNIGEIAWFTTTVAGDEHVEAPISGARRIP